MENLPPGSWISCEIPTTYWTLIYCEYWEIIIDCTKNNNNIFLFDQVFLTENLNKLNINDFNEGEEDNEDEEEEIEEEQD